jgi:hypothetical protein
MSPRTPREGDNSPLLRLPEKKQEAPEVIPAVVMSLRHDAQEQAVAAAIDAEKEMANAAAIATAERQASMVTPAVTAHRMTEAVARRDSVESTSSGVGLTATATTRSVTTPNQSGLLQPATALQELPLGTFAEDGGGAAVAEKAAEEVAAAAAAELAAAASAAAEEAAAATREEVLRLQAALAEERAASTKLTMELAQASVQVSAREPGTLTLTQGRLLCCQTQNNRLREQGALGFYLLLCGTVSTLSARHLHHADQSAVLVRTDAPSSLRDVGFLFCRTAGGGDAPCAYRGRLAGGQQQRGSCSAGSQR